MPNGDCHAPFRNPKFLNELQPHARGVDEDVVARPVLGPESQTVQRRVVAIPLSSVDIVRREHDPLAQRTVIPHQQRAIERFEPVVPENVEDVGAGIRGVADQAGVIPQHTTHLRARTRLRSLIPAEVEKVYAGTVLQQRSIQLITADHIQSNPGTKQGVGQAEHIGPVTATGQQRGVDGRHLRLVLRTSRRERHGTNLGRGLDQHRSTG